MRFRNLTGWRGVTVLESAYSRGCFFSNLNHIVVGVHLFMPEYMPVNYDETVNEVLMHYEGPVVILEEKSCFDIMKKRVKPLSPVSERYFIKTAVCDIRMPALSFQRFADFLRSFSNHSLIQLMGGSHTGSYESSMNCGCLGSLDYELTRAGFRTELVQDGTYSDH